MQVLAAPTSPGQRGLPQGRPGQMNAGQADWGPLNSCFKSAIPKGWGSYTPRWRHLPRGEWLQYFGHLMRKADSLENFLILGKIEGRRRRGRQGMRWWLNWHKFGQTPGDSKEEGSLVCCRSWVHKVSDTTEQQHNKSSCFHLCFSFTRYSPLGSQVSC